MNRLLEFENVEYSYPSGIKALDNISFSMNPGERVALLGLNGSGKSTLLLHTNGLLLPMQGEVTVNGEPTSVKELRRIRQRVGMVFQNADDQLFMPTVWDDVTFGPSNMGLSKEEIDSRANRALESINCMHLKDRSPLQLSGGQKKLVSIATVLSMNPELLVLDEPTSGLDYAAVRDFIDVMSALPHSILMSTHDVELSKKLCSRAIVLDEGKIIYDGSIADVIYPHK